MTEQTKDTVRQAVRDLRRQKTVRDAIGDRAARNLASVIDDPALSARALHALGWNVTNKRRAILSGAAGAK